MSDQDKLKNIFAFLSILLGEDLHLSTVLINLHPSYLIEKWERYVESTEIEHPWGLHPNLKHQFFDEYFKKWEEDILDD